jgi:hypothetical protein
VVLLRADVDICVVSLVLNDDDDDDDIINTATTRQYSGTTKHFIMQLAHSQLSSTTASTSSNTLTARIYEASAPLWRHFDFIYIL